MLSEPSDFAAALEQYRGLPMKNGHPLGTLGQLIQPAAVMGGRIGHLTSPPRVSKELVYPHALKLDAEHMRAKHEARDKALTSAQGAPCAPCFLLAIRLFVKPKGLFGKTCIKSHPARQPQSGIRKAFNDTANREERKGVYGPVYCLCDWLLSNEEDTGTTAFTSFLNVARRRHSPDSPSRSPKSQMALSLSHRGPIRRRTHRARAIHSRAA
ncbi:hypothetical protein MRX96_029669 [Rhipicephalus microplus]